MSDYVPIGQLNVMMALGGFQFSVKSAAYQEWNRTTEYLWPTQQRFGKRPSAQFIGVGDDSIELPGVIYPEYRGGFGQIEAMRTMAAAGTPLSMVDGSGNVMGKWVIMSVTEKSTIFAAFGVPRKMEFTLALQYFYVEPVSILTAISSAAATATGATDTSTLGQLKTQASSALESITNTVSSGLKSVSGAIATATSYVNEAATIIQPVLAKGAQVYSAASELYTTAQTVKASMSNISSVSTLISSMGTVSAAASKLSQAGTTASPLAVSSVSTVAAAGGSADGIDSLKQLATSIGNITVTATRSYTLANNVVKAAS